MAMAGFTYGLDIGGITPRRASGRASLPGASMRDRWRVAEDDEVRVAETWRAHGYGRSVLGVYSSREAAFEALKAQPGMTAWVDEHGNVRGRPRNEDRFGAEWGWASPWGVCGPPSSRCSA